MVTKNNNDYKIIPIKCLADNYCYIIELKGTKDVILFDASQSTPIKDKLQAGAYNLAHLVLTHHHHDHLGAIDDLLAQHPKLTGYGHWELSKHIEVSKFSQFKQYNNNRDQVAHIGDLSFSLLYLPGHASSSIGFLLDNHLFIGDVVFKAGCGGIFGGISSYKEMWQSINSINSLPADTLLYPGHDLSLDNLKFAQAIEPNNEFIKSEIARPSCVTPTNIALERKINPFFKTAKPEFQAKVRAFLKANNHHAELLEITNSPPEKLSFITFLIIRKLKSRWKC
ncbi:MAG: MBL fold metallo-hydrolase [SAR324 cluster bacterium]|nr:MBL fold metallo-hydrolase [SAR324 cluster bacterium]